MKRHRGLGLIMGFLIWIVISGTIPVKAQSISLVFQGETERFVETQGTIDGFEDLGPGYSRRQSLIITNEDETTRSFYMQVQIPEEFGDGSGIFTMELTRDDEILYEGTSQGLIPLVEGDLENRVRLATLAQGESVQVDLDITMDGSLGNEYQNQEGTIAFLISTELEKKEEHETDPKPTVKPTISASTKPGATRVTVTPKTGDNESITIYLIGLVIPLLVLAILVWQRKRRDR